MRKIAKVLWPSTPSAMKFTLPLRTVGKAHQAGLGWRWHWHCFPALHCPGAPELHGPCVANSSSAAEGRAPGALWRYGRSCSAAGLSHQAIALQSIVHL